MSPHKPERAEIGKQASITGFANEHIVVGMLMKKYSNVSLVNLPLSSYDIVLVREVDEKEDFIRIQVKTAISSINFLGGSRGGVDREYKTDTNISKVYRQSPELSDIIIGLHENNDGSFDLYFVPTLLIEVWNQNSISLRKISALKNNYLFLDNCKNKEWILSEAKRLSII